MDTPHSSSEQNSSDVNTATIGDGAQVGQFAQGSNITQVTGFTAAQVTVLLDKIRTEYQSKSFDGRSPYIGLASFQERDADKFFGRETLTAELVTRVVASAATNARAVFVAGPSGSGKSSLVRAGLVPALKKGNAAGSEHWLYETMRPGRAPLDELARVVSSFANSPDAGDDFRAHALDDATRLYRWADIALKDDGQRRAVIVIDQFEEIFTQLSPERETERVAFLNLLTHAATAENGRVLVIFTLRSDFVSNCASYQNLNALVNQQFIQVGAMTREELVSAIARPAYQVGLRIDPALISQIVNDVRGEPGALPLMQFALQDLFEAEKQKGELTLDGYLARGGLHQALERHADAEFAKLDDAEKQLARSVFSGLVEIGRGREDTKRTALFGELVPAGADATHVQALVHKLADARLITTDEQDGKETVTLAHERLIDAWDWLRRLVDENRDAIALQNEIAQDAQEWEIQNRDESYLYRGARLATAQEKLQQNQLVLNSLAHEFLETAFAARELERVERDLERQREVEQEERMRMIAEESSARRIAANSIAIRNSQFDLALLLAVQATRVRQNFETRRILFDTLASDSMSRIVFRHQYAVQSVAFSPNGKILAVGDAGGNISLWDVATRKLLRQPFKNQMEGVNIIVFNPNGEILAVGDSGGRIWLWNLVTGQLVGQPINADEDSVLSLGFTPDGKTLASGHASSEVCLWDVSTQQPKGKPFNCPGFVSVTVSPSGQVLAVADQTWEIQIWEVMTNQLLYQLRKQSHWVKGVVFSPDGKTLASLGVDGDLILWDLMRYEPIGEPLTEPLNVGSSVAFSPDGRTIAGGDDRGGIGCWDVGTREMIGHELIRHKDSVNSLAFSPDSKIVASGSSDHTVILWDVRRRDSIRQEIGVPGISVTCIAYNPCENVLAIGSSDQRIHLWDVCGGRILSKSDESHQSQSHSWDGVNRIAFSPDGKLMASAGSDHLIRLWEVETLQMMGEPIEGHGNWVDCLAFSPDGKRLATIIGNKITVWDVNTHEPLNQMFEGESYSSSTLQGIFSRDLKTLAMTDRDNNILLLDTETHRSIGQLFLGATLQSVDLAFNPDGTTLATVVSMNDNFEVLFWDIGKLEPRGQPLRGSGGNVRSLAFSPDGEMLAVGTSEGYIWLWAVDLQQPLGEPLDARQGRYTTMNMDIDHIAFSSDGKTLASLRRDGQLLLWSLDLATWQDLGCIIANRNITHDEWTEYVNSGDETWVGYVKNPTCPNFPVQE